MINMGHNVIDTLIGILGTAVLGIFGWAFALSSRVGVLEESHKNFEKLIDTKFDNLMRLNEAIGENIDIKFEASAQRLDRIERSMNGHLKRD